MCNNEVQLCKIHNHRGNVSRRLATSDLRCRKFMHTPHAQSDGIKSVDLKSPYELTEEESPAASRSRASLCILRH